MKTEKLSGTIESAYGNPLPTPVKYAGEVKVFETAEEVRAAGEWPKDSDVVSFVNQREKANQRQKLMSAALDAAGIKKPTLEDPSEQFKQMVKILSATGKDEATARQLANATLGTNF